MANWSNMKNERGFRQTTSAENNTTFLLHCSNNDDDGELCESLVSMLRVSSCQAIRTKTRGIFTCRIANFSRQLDWNGFDGGIPWIRFVATESSSLCQSRTPWDWQIRRQLYTEHRHAYTTYSIYNNFTALLPGQPGLADTRKQYTYA